jgi:hypothetical protein
MMSGVSLETCWGIKKHWSNKLYYTVASCWLFLYDFSSGYIITDATVVKVIKKKLLMIFLDVICYI